MKVRCALLGLSLMFGTACSDVQFVDRIVIDNPTRFHANVDVSDGARESWLALAAVETGTQSVVEQVVDQGSTWVFRFAYSGHQQEIRLSRAELADAGWRVEVPTSFEAALRDRGISPPP